MPSTIFKLLGLTTEDYMDHIKVLFKYIFLIMIFFKYRTNLFILSFLAELQVQVTLRTLKCVCAISLFIVRDARPVSRRAETLSAVDL